MTSTFGREWSLALCKGAASLGVRVEWVLAVDALESGFNPYARNASGAFGQFQRMPDANRVPYRETNPVKQLVDAFAFWRSMVTTFRIAGFPTRGTFYTLNLAPARLKGAPTHETVLYSMRQDLHPREYWPQGYKQNRNLSRIVGHTESGAPILREWIAIEDLEPSLDAAVRRCQARYNAELEMAYAVSANAGRETPVAL